MFFIRLFITFNLVYYGIYLRGRRGTLLKVLQSQLSCLVGDMVAGGRLIDFEIRAATSY